MERDSLSFGQILLIAIVVIGVVAIFFLARSNSPQREEERAQSANVTIDLSESEIVDVEKKQ